MATRIVNSTEINISYGHARKRLIVLDYDGTLISPKHYRAAPDPSVLELLGQLAKDNRNCVVVVSGREKSKLDNDLSHLPITIVAEYGAAYRDPERDWTQTSDYSASWIGKTLPALKALAFHYWGSDIERKEFSLVWRYDSVRDGIPDSDKRQIMSALRSLPVANEFKLVDGNLFLELRTPGINKGAFISRWVGSRHFDFIMDMGDGHSDEELFKLFGKDSFTIRVDKSEHSSANYHLGGQEDVVPFLTTILTSKERVNGFMTSDETLLNNNG